MLVDLMIGISLIDPRKRAIRHSPEGEYDGPDEILRPSFNNSGRLSVVSEVDSVRSPSPEGRPRESSGTRIPCMTFEDIRESSASSSSSRAGGSSAQQVRSISPQPVHLNLQEFHVLFWIAIRLGRSPTSIHPSSESNGSNERTRTDRESIQMYFRSLNEWLEKQADLKARAAYQNGAHKSWTEVSGALKGMMRGQFDNEPVEEMKDKLVHAVRVIVQFFIPVEQPNAMCSKIWGSVHNIITVCGFSESGK